MIAEKAFQSLIKGENLSKEALIAILSEPEMDAPLCREARKKADAVFGKEIYLRGLLEISSYCKNDCYYCGLRRSNAAAIRYRLSGEEILSAAAAGYKEGIRTFVLQGGEDAYFTKTVVGDIIKNLKEKCPKAAITLSLGERSEAEYAFWRLCGADRYLLRHETASRTHYSRLHPPEMTLASRMECLTSLKALGYQVGAGFMVGSPYQTIENIAEDLLFLQTFRPHMIGIGPFMPQAQTPFSGFPAGSLAMTIKLIAILRLMHQKALLPATTALASLSEDGREKGILAGANVVMPNLSPPTVRGKYAIYDNKAQEGIDEVRRKIEELGYTIHEGRGDYQ